MEEFLQKIPDLIQVVSVCLFAVMILATIIVRLTPSKADDEYASKAGAFIMKVLGWLPTLGINPRTKEQAEELKKLKDAYLALQTKVDETPKDAA